MTRHHVFRMLVALACVICIYAGWRWLMIEDVARIQESIGHYNASFKKASPTMVLRADSVEPSGFPFQRNVVIYQLSVSMIEGDETFMVRFPEVKLTHARNGYEVKLPDETEALYAKAGSEPELFRIHTRGLEEITLSPKDGIPQEYRVRMVWPISFDVRYKESTDTIRFNGMIPIIQRSIPDSLERELWMAVSVLREAMVFKTKH